MSDSVVLKSCIQRAGWHINLRCLFGGVLVVIFDVQDASAVLGIAIALAWRGVLFNSNSFFLA